MTTQQSDKSGRYSGVAIALHWILALGLTANVVIALTYPLFGDENIRFFIDTHKSIGITLLGFALLRVLWRFTHQPPAYPYQQPALENFLAKATHTFLYALMLLIPISGWMHDSAWKAAPEIKMYWFGFFEWPRISWIMQVEAETKEMLHGLFGGVHEWMSYALYALVALHVIAALKHHFDKENRVRGRGILP